MSMTETQKAIYQVLCDRAMHESTPRYVDQSDGSLYVLNPSGKGMLMFTGDFKGRSDEYLKAFVKKALGPNNEHIPGILRAAFRNRSS
jgi:hypothetical protein